ncbi:MAG: hydroxyethylthiazole kinase [Oscillospiraceae bacterium]|nr:hydroxyethylthiazole kinase [Oscillospiraceae bacterium]
MKIAEILVKMREKRPLVHCIGNDISTADTANLLLAAGARPIMSYAPQEAEEISRACRATVLNCGTPIQEKFDGLANAAKGAANHPVIIDPVGAGASRWRKQNIVTLIENSRVDIIHCNYSEALALTDTDTAFAGVDSIDDEQSCRITAARALALKYGCTVVMTGRKDIVTDGVKTAVVHGGSSMMSLVSGSGCMLGALLAAFATAGHSFECSVAACAFWKKCAEMAGERAHSPGGLRAALADAAYELQPQRLEEVKIDYR